MDPDKNFKFRVKWEGRYVAGVSKVSALKRNEAVTLPVFRADLRALATYKYVEEYRLTCPILALSGTNDPEANSAQVSAWKDHTSGHAETRTFKGDHFFTRDHRGSVIHAIVASSGLSKPDA